MRRLQPPERSTARNIPTAIRVRAYQSTPVVATTMNSQLAAAHHHLAGCVAPSARCPARLPCLMPLPLSPSVPSPPVT